MKVETLRFLQLKGEERTAYGSLNAAGLRSRCERCCAGCGRWEGSAIARLMELVVRSVIQKRAEIQTWQAHVSQQYRELTDPEKLTELNDLAFELTKSLKTLYDDTAVDGCHISCFALLKLIRFDVQIPKQFNGISLVSETFSAFTLSARSRWAASGPSS